MYDPASGNEPAPPPYELSREIYDFKTSEALRRSTTILRETDVDRDGFEVWNEDAYQANARALSFAQYSENVSSGSQAAGSTSGQSSTTYAGSASAFMSYPSEKQKGKMVSDKGMDGYGHGGTQPLNVQKRPVGVRALPAPPVPRLETALIANYPMDQPHRAAGPHSPTSSSVTEEEEDSYQPPCASSSRQASMLSPELPSFGAIDTYSVTTPTQGANLGRAPTYVEFPRATPRPRTSLPAPQTPANYPTTQYATPPSQRSSRVSLPPNSIHATYTQPAPPPTPPSRAEFNNRGPVVQFDPVKAYRVPNTFGSLPRDPLTHAPNAAALYSSSVASHVAHKPPPPPPLPPHRRSSTFGAYPASPSQLLPAPTAGFAPGQFAPGQLPPGAGVPFNPSARSLTPQQQYAPAGQFYPPQGGYLPQQQQSNQPYYTPAPQPPPPGAYSRPMPTYPQPGWPAGQYGR